MNRIMTAEKFIDAHGEPLYVDASGDPVYVDRDVQDLMIAFAKYHVEKAMEAAKDSAGIFLVKYKDAEVEVLDYLGEEITTKVEGEYIAVNTKVIGESYPLSNIK